MAYNSRRIIVDFDGKPVPQYYNESLDAYEVNKGHAGGSSFHEIGTIVTDMFSGDTTQTKNLSTLGVGFAIKNDGSEDITVTINEFSFVVKAGEAYFAKFMPFSSVTITVPTSSAYRVEISK